jgi:hypothetical protein
MRQKHSRVRGQRRPGAPLQEGKDSESLRGPKEKLLEIRWKNGR